MVTLNVYAHLFEDNLDRLYEGLDAPLSDPQTAPRPPGAASGSTPAKLRRPQTGL